MNQDAPVCCGRAMSGIGVTRDDGVLLRSCPSCGRHAWMSGARELSREELIDLLRDEPAPVTAPRAARASSPRRAAAARVAAPAPAVAEPPADRRAELQDLLRGFTVHGTSS